MRTWVGTLVLAATLATGCTGGDDDAGGTAEAAARAGDLTCEEVRAGVAAFNESLYEETVERFRAALPPAKEYARLSDDTVADDLLEAVQYYADLPAAEYREAFESSPDFTKYQVITLGQCEEPPGEDGEGTQA